MERHLVAKADELPPGERKLVTVKGREIGVFNVGDEYYALLNTCPHAGGPLCLGDITGTTAAGEQHYELDWVDAGKILRCPWHAWEFYLTTGRSVGDGRMRVPTFAVVREGDDVFVEM